MADDTPIINGSVSQIHFSTLVNHSHDGIVIVSPEGMLKYASPSVERLMGYSPAELLGVDPATSTHPDDLPELKPLLAKVLTTPGHTETATYRVFHKNGTIRWVESNITNCLQVEGVNGLVFNYRDITEKIIAQEQLALERETRNGLINSMSDLMWSVSDQFILTDCNIAFKQAIREILGRDVQIGEHILWTNVLNVDTTLLWEDRYKKALAGQAFTEEVLIDINGTLSWTEVSFSPIRSNNGITGVACHVRDINERKGTEAKLAQSEQNMAMAQRIANVGSWELDLTTYASTWSEQAYRILGYEPYSVTPSFESFLARVHPDDLEFAKTTAENAVANKSNYAIEHRLLLPDGSIKWIASEGQIIIDPQKGTALKIVGSNQDITSRKRAADELTIFRRNRDALINNIPDLLWSVDHNYTLLDGNAAFYRAVEYLSGKAIAPGQNVMYDGLDAASKIQWSTLYNRALKGETFTEQVFIIAQDSGWSEVTMSPIYDGDNIIGSACYSKDVNERRHAEERVRQSEQNMAHAQRLAHIGSWDIELVDGNPFIKKPIWSDETFRILGFNKNETTPSLELFLSLIHPDDKDYVINAISSGISNNDNAPIVYRIIRPDGTMRWIESEGEIHHDAEGKPIRILGTHQDITEAKLYEKEREKMTADLIQRNKELEQFAYIVSHNLRGPVSNIIGLSNELELDAPADDINHVFLTELKNSVAKLDSVIKDLGYILQRKREITEQKETVNFDELVKDIKGSISHMVAENNAIIETNFSAVAELNTLKSYLYSIFYNLISNSIKYRRADVAPHITITSTTDSDGYVNLMFTDNGIGIDMEKYGEKVFGLYRRFHSHTEGKGMGLYMTKSQIESLGGTIAISSQINSGTQFLIRFKM